MSPAFLLVLVLLLGGASPTTLRLGDHPVEQTLSAGEPQVYSIQLAAGEYARVLVRKKGADVEILARSPEGREIAAPAGPPDRFSTEVISILADSPGLYTIEVKPRTAAETSGGFAINLVEKRPAEPPDRRRVEAERTQAEAYRLADRGRPEDVTAALSLYQKAGEIWQGLGDASQQAYVLYQTGLAQVGAGESTAAVASFEKALALQQNLDELRQASYTLSQMGRAYRLLGDTAKALDSYQRSLALASRIPREEQTLAVYFNQGRVYQDTGRLREAGEAYDQGLALSREQGDRTGEAVAYLHLGGLDNLEGRSADAVERFEQALAIAHPLKLQDIEIQSLVSLGALYRRLGQPNTALERFTAAMDLMAGAQSYSLQGSVLLNVGSLLVELGDYAEGREMLQRALPLLSNPREEAVARISLGRTARAMGEPQEALKQFDRALEIQRSVGDRSGEALSVRSKAFVMLDQGDPAAARGLLIAVLPALQELGDLAGEMEASQGLGRSWTGLGDFAAADQSYQRALDLSRSLGDTGAETRILEDMARSQQARGKLDMARKNLEDALGRIESLRAEIAGDHLRATHFATRREVYAMAVDILEQLHRQKPEDGLETLAFETAERARARGMLDFLGQARVEIGDPDLLKEEQRLRLEMNAKASLRAGQLHKPEGAKEAEALDRELTSLEAQYRIVEARLQAKSPQYSQLRQPEISLTRIRREALDVDTILLEYFLAEPRSYLWLVTPDALASFELPGRAKIEELAKRVHEQLGRLDPQSGPEERKDLAELSRLLLGPVAGHLKGKRLAIVPDGALLYVPFPALPVPAADGSGSVPLVVEHEVVQLPSAAVVRELRHDREGRPRPPAALALLADPVFEKNDPRLQAAVVGTPPQVDTTRSDAFARLSWTRREAEAIVTEAQGRDVLLALDFRANRELATASDLDRYRIVHFATHGVLDTQHPALSGLVFSQVNEQGKPQDGFLRLHDIYHLHLNADLVVLSGCETALGKTLRGEGILGLTRGFFHAGASQVLASLWPVRDRATAELMQRFYRGMFKDGLPASAALRQAQISMWKERPWRDPYFWAAFVLQGDWQAGGR